MVLQQRQESRSIKEFGNAHGFSKPTVYRMIARGELVARKAGRRTIITGADEAAWLEALPRLHAKAA
jgi:excisionase family DNA binding protein